MDATGEAAKLGCIQEGDQVIQVIDLNINVSPIAIYIVHELSVTV